MYLSQIFLDTLEDKNYDSISQLIIGGDFNAHLDPELDNAGGKTNKKDSVKNIIDITIAFDLVDIWRIRNTDKRQYTWRQKRPLIQRRLDYWLISDCMQDIIGHTDIIPSIKSDHSAITLQINSITDQARGPSHWCFNSSLLSDEKYIELISAKYDEWIQEFAEVHDNRLLWDLMKYRIRQTAITYSKEKAEERRNRLRDVENKLKKSEELCANNPSEENIEAFEEVKIEYNSLYDYITQGNIIRSKANWYEKGEKNNKYFLSLEKNRNAKTCIRKLVDKQGKEIINSKAIMAELKGFYQDLCENKDHGSCADDIHSFIGNLEIPKLSDELQRQCEGSLTYAECRKVLNHREMMV